MIQQGEGIQYYISTYSKRKSEKRARGKVAREKHRSRGEHRRRGKDGRATNKTKRKEKARRNDRRKGKLEYRSWN